MHARNDSTTLLGSVPCCVGVRNSGWRGLQEGKAGADSSGSKMNLGAVSEGEIFVTLWFSFKRSCGCNGHVLDVVSECCVNVACQLTVYTVQYLTAISIIPPMHDDNTTLGSFL